jgi:7,8-dihydropterin-6-yl-methyl-4-(beta-D-ribofuranosyl)aminobenzene 5'-phosphate synthase
MLFNLCNCAVPLASSAGSLCVGGAGFVTAVMATLAANSRTRHAKTLRERVPKVDRLAVRIVTDNLTQLFVPDEARDGLAIERRVPYSYPDRAPRHILNAEWGLSLHAQSFAADEERNVLVDFGFTPEVLNTTWQLLGSTPRRSTQWSLATDITIISAAWLAFFRSTVRR